MESFLPSGLLVLVVSFVVGDGCADIDPVSCQANPAICRNPVLAVQICPVSCNKCPILKPVVRFLLDKSCVESNPFGCQANPAICGNEMLAVQVCPVTCNRCPTSAPTTATPTTTTLAPATPAPTTSTTTKAAHTTNLQYRLRDGPGNNEGRLEVLYGGVWGTVCDDNFNNNAAKIICNTLGVTYVRAMVGQSGKYGPGSGQIWLDDVTCFVNETSIVQCKHNDFGVNDCVHSEDVGVVCATNCVDKVDCHQYGSNACSKQFEAWSRDNCQKLCGYCTATLIHGAGTLYGDYPVSDGNQLHFNMTNHQKTSIITGVRLFCDANLLAIQLQYNHIWAQRYGANQDCLAAYPITNTLTYEFYPTEWLNGADVSVIYGGWPRALTLHTNKRQLPTCADHSTPPYSERGDRLLGIAGWSGCWLDKLQFIWSE